VKIGERLKKPLGRRRGNCLHLGCWNQRKKKKADLTIKGGGEREKEMKYKSPDKDRLLKEMEVQKSFIKSRNLSPKVPNQNKPTV